MESIKLISVVWNVDGCRYIIKAHKTHIFRGSDISYVDWQSNDNKVVWGKDFLAFLKRKGLKITKATEFSFH